MSLLEGAVTSCGILPRTGAVSYTHLNDSGLVRLRRFSTDEIVGTEGKAGLIERYFSLMPEGDTTLQDIGK